MIDIAKLGFAIDSTGAVRATKNLDQMTGASNRASKSSDLLAERSAATGRMLGRMITVGTAALSAMTANSIRLAVAAEETASKFQVVFRGSVVEANARLIELSKTIPLTITQMRGLAAGVQDMLVPMGLVRAEAANLSTEMIRVAGDIGAFNDTDVDQVLRDFQSALSGQIEPLRKFGIFLTQDRLKAIALRDGLIDLGGELTTAARAQATFTAIQEDSSDAMGTAAREVGSTASQLRFLSAGFRQAQENLGKVLLPAFNELITTMNTADEQGFTPLQRVMVNISVEMLNVVKGIIHMRIAWLEFVDFISPSFAVMQGIADKLEATNEGARQLGENMRTAIAAQISGLTSFAEILGMSDESTESMVENTEELTDAEKDRAKTIARLNKLIDGLTASQDELRAGLSRTLEDAHADMGEVADVVSGRVIPALREMSATIRDDLAASLAFVQQEGFGLQAQALQDEIDALNGGAEAWRAYQKAMFEAQQVADLGPDATEEQVATIQKLAGELFEARDAFDSVADSASKLGEVMMESADIAADAFRDLQKGVGREDKMYDKLTVAIEAANVVKAIGAVLTQGEGDPYTAFARMAAMAAAVASLGYSVGNLSGGFSDTAADRQASQGTGSVLGDAAAKSESISKAVEITANATSELVGINKGMLHALQSLSAGISGGANVLARTSSGGQFSGLPNTFQPSDFLPGDIFAGIWDSLLGGSAKVTDEGIAILSGTIGDLIDGTLIAAFQEVQYKKWAFGSKKTREELIELGGEAAAQFGLIFEALADTVREGALALGMSQELIDQRLAAFEVAEQRISLMDLTAEEQAAEIEAVISTIFDDLVASVVPFVRQFQQVGEGLGETLIRVATSVQVFQEAVQQLPFAADATDPEAFAIMAVGLADLVGGVENFIALFTGFMDKFASDEQKLTFVTDQLTRAFEQADMVLPETRDGFWALMQSMDASTEAGRQQIATLLQLAPIADQYYSLIDEAERDRLAAAEMAAKAASDALALIQQQTDTVRDFVGLGPSQALVDLQKNFAEAMEAAQSLGASHAEYAMIVRAFYRQMSVMAAQLTRTVIQLSQDLFSASTDGFVDSVETGINEVRLVANSLFGEWQTALTNLKGFADGLLLDESLTTLTPRQQLSEAQRQFEATLAAARGGDVEAAGNLPDMARAFLDEARFMFASGAAYDAIFKQVQQALRGVEMPKGIEEFTREIASNTADTVTAVKTMQDEIIAGLDRMLKAMDLSNALRDLSYVLDRGTVGLAQELGVPLDQLAAALGIDVSDLSQDTLMGLANMAELLGADLRELGGALGIDLDALAASFGIQLDSLMFETQFAREIDVLGSIFLELEKANLWLELLVNPFLDNKSKEGPTTAPSTPVTTPQTAGGTTTMTTEEAGEVIRLLTELRDMEEQKAKAYAEANRQIVQAQSATTEAVRRIA